MVNCRSLLSLLVLATTCSCTCRVRRDVFGSYEVPELGGRQGTVYRYTLDNGRVTVQVIEYGATITSVRMADNLGHVDDVLLGFDNIEGYLNVGNQYLGATVGRVANRVAGGQFTLDGVTYSLARNNGNNSLHGGLRGFDKKLWVGEMVDGGVVLRYTSGDGEEGYPGEVRVAVTYSLAEDNTLVIEYNATSTKRTPINLTNHAYFNLAGHAAGAGSMYNHEIFIAADYITETRSDFIPTGNLKPVDGSPWDLRKPKNIGEGIRGTPIDGFDDNFVLQPGGVVATVTEPSSGRKLEVQTTQPGLQFYTSNTLSPVVGKDRATYSRHAAFCLEAQNFPDAINHQMNFPNSVFGLNQSYHQVIAYRFVEPTISGSNFLKPTCYCIILCLFSYVGYV